MHDRVRLPRYVRRSRAYKPVSFALPDFERLLSTSEHRGRDRRAVLALLGLGNRTHISSHVERSSASVTLMPLARTVRKGPAYLVELVRSYGRGYVIPDVTLRYGQETVTGALAVKGSGLEAWAVDNESWIAWENANHGLIMGCVSSENAAGDLYGEFWARSAGLTAPVLVYCARRRYGYQIARLWRCPYRIWELTSGPFRTGPHVTQAFTHLNWAVELAFAIKYRDLIAARARSCLSELSRRGADAAFLNLERTTLDNVVKLTAFELQLSPFTLHLANIGYSGETTGFDRIKGPFTHPDAFRLGVLMALLEAWAALSWLGAAIGRRTPRFGTFFEKFQAQLESSPVRRKTARMFLEGSSVARAFSRVDVRGFVVCRNRFLFGRRHPDDIPLFLRAAETFFDGLRQSFDGELRSAGQLQRWGERVNFARCEEIRIWQSKGADASSATFARLVREHQALDSVCRRFLAV